MGLMMNISEIKNTKFDLDLKETEHFRSLCDSLEFLFVRNDEIEGVPSEQDYQKLISEILKHPNSDWMIQQLFEKISEQSGAQSQQGTSTQGLELKLLPPLPQNEKNQRLKKALELELEKRRSAVQSLKKNKPQLKPTPKAIKALDALLDGITSLFAELPQEKKLLNKKAAQKFPPRPSPYRN